LLCALCGVVTHHPWFEEEFIVEEHQAEAKLPPETTADDVSFKFENQN
jgi:hypothetical protein